MVEPIINIDTLYVELCGYKPEEVNWDFRNSQRYKTFKIGADSVLEKMNPFIFALKSRIRELEKDNENVKNAYNELLQIAKKPGR